MSFLSRIAQGAAATASSVERSHPAAGRVLTVGDLVHVPRRALPSGDAAEGDSSAADVEAAAHAPPARSADSTATASAPRTVDAHSPAPSQDGAAVLASSAPAQIVPIEPAMPAQPGLDATHSDPAAAPMRDAQPARAALEQPSHLPAPAIGAVWVHATHGETHTRRHERSSAAAADSVPAGRSATQRVASDSAQQATPQLVSLGRTPDEAVMPPAKIQQPAPAQPLAMNAAGVAAAGSVSCAQQAIVSSQPAAMSFQWASQPRAEAMAAPRAFEPRPATAAAPPPRVHIGSIEVSVAAPAEPKATPAAALRGASFSSRHYLRGL